MDRKGKLLQALIEQLGQSDERSPLFWYLFEHHDEIVAAARGQRMRWQSLCATFEALGLTDRSGQAPSAETARRTWKRVRREVARRMREKLTGIPARKKQPRDLPANTMPMLAAPQPGACRQIHMSGTVIGNLGEQLLGEAIEWSAPLE